jgi:CDGSH-type Zn-finger protein/uncharacterized Fe-S cluster protein YjdI
MPSQIRKYTGKQIDVSYDPGRCIHVAECLRRAPAVFDKSKRPWVQPDNDATDRVVTTIMACPSGALHYTRKEGGEAEPVPAQNTIRLARNGPLYIRGDVVILNSAGEEILHDTRVALCRCGASANKPFCDNSHIAIGFQAPVMGEEGQTVIEPEGSSPLTIETTTNGPLHITGNFTVLNSRGKPIFHSGEEWFCRCGASANKPFCDNSHRQINFVAE